MLSTDREIMNYDNVNNLHDSTMIDDSQEARDDHCYPWRYCMNEHRINNRGEVTSYCVHAQIFPYDGDQIPYRVWGTYDLSYEDAMKLLKSKASSMGATIN